MNNTTSELHFPIDGYYWIDKSQFLFSIPIYFIETTSVLFYVSLMASVDTYVANTLILFIGQIELISEELKLIKENYNGYDSVSLNQIIIYHQMIARCVLILSVIIYLIKP